MRSSFHMTSLRTAITQATCFDLERNEALIERLRREAAQRLASAPNTSTDLLTICRLIFDILSLQDKINQDRQQISVFNA